MRNDPGSSEAARPSWPVLYASIAVILSALNSAAPRPAASTTTPSSARRPRATGTATGVTGWTGSSAPLEPQNTSVGVASNSTASNDAVLLPATPTLVFWGSMGALLPVQPVTPVAVPVAVPMARGRRALLGVVVLA